MLIFDQLIKDEHQGIGLTYVNPSLNKKSWHEKTSLSFSRPKSVAINGLYSLLGYYSRRRNVYAQLQWWRYSSHLWCCYDTLFNVRVVERRCSRVDLSGSPHISRASRSSLWDDIVHSFRDNVFSGIFLGFLHSSLAPTVEIGAVWPPKGIQVLNPWEIPFLNTIILLSSGASVTWAHHAILAGFREQGIVALAVTIALALVLLLSKRTNIWRLHLL